MSRIFDSSQLGVNAESLTTPANAVYNNLARSSFTWSMWVRPTASPDGVFSTILIKDPVTAYSPYIQFNGNGTTTLNADVTSDTSATNSTTQNELALNTWSNVIMTFDFNGDKTIHIYINGVEAIYSGTPTALTGTPSDDSGGGFVIGNDDFGDGWDGNIAEVAVWNKVLTGPQITAVAASTTGVASIQSANLVGYWHLCGTASPEPDATINGNNAVLSSNPPIKGVDSPGFSCGGNNPVVTKNGNIMVFTIQKAVLLATGNQATNYAVYQVDSGPEILIGETVVIAGCTTGTFNGTFTVAATGTFVVPNNPSDTAGGSSVWTGFSVIINHAAIGIEIEPTLPTDGAEGSPTGTATVTVTQ